MENIIEKDNIYISDAKDSESLFEEIYNNLLDDGLVNENFLEKIKEREKNYPTGLDMSVLDKGIPDIAIPHTDPDTCKVTRIIPIKLNNKIEFKNMIEPDKTVNARFAFIILNNEGSQQTDMLARIMEFMSHTKDIDKLFKLDNIDDLYQFIKKHL